MPDIAVHFIHFDDLGRGTLDLCDFFPQSFDPLIDGHMAKPYDPTDRSKAQALQVQGYSHAALCGGRSIGLVSNRIQIPAAFALVALMAVDRATFDSVSTGTSWTIQHKHLPKI